MKQSSIAITLLGLMLLLAACHTPPPAFTFEGTTILMTALFLAACQIPNHNALITPAGKWDSSAWNEAQWE